MRKQWVQGLAICVLAASVAGACATTGRTTVDGSPPTGERLTGKFVWHDLLSDDPELAERFYAELLGWQFERTTRLGATYFIARVNGQAVAGLVPVPRREPARPVSQWIAYVSVPSVERAVRQVEARGGTVARGPVSVGGVGRAAIARDFAGAPFGIAAATGGDPPDGGEPVLGTFFWMEYLADDVAVALDFYRNVIGYRPDGSPNADGYHLLASDRARGGLYANPVAETRPVWLPYVRVADPAALAARVSDLGGRVLLAPSNSVRAGSLAIVADPSGAVLALQRLPL